MAEKNMCEVCGSGDGRCGECGNMCGYRGNNLLRWLLGIIIITWIFTIGMKFGELKAQMDGGNHMYFRSMGVPVSGSAMMNNADFTISTQAMPAGKVQVIKTN